MGQLERQWRVYHRNSPNQVARNDLIERIWLEYYARLTIFVGPMLRSQSADGLLEVDDVVQEIIVKVMANIDLYNPRFSFNTWIYTIARNHCRDLMRKAAVRNRRLSTRPAEELPSATAGPEEVLLRKEEEATARGVIESLSPRERQIAFLRFSEGMTYDEIGRVLGMPPGTAKYRIHLIRKGVAHALETPAR